jgi:hypothetical protein
MFHLRQYKITERKFYESIIESLEELMVSIPKQQLSSATISARQRVGELNAADSSHIFHLKVADRMTAHVAVPGNEVPIITG